MCHVQRLAAVVIERADHHADEIAPGRELKLETRLNGVAAPDTVRVQLGTLLLGLSWKLSPKRTLSLTLGAGVTRDTPDVTLTVRMPVSS